LNKSHLWWMWYRSLRFSNWVKNLKTLVLKVCHVKTRHSRSSVSLGAISYSKLGILVFFWWLSEFPLSCFCQQLCVALSRSLPRQIAKTNETRDSSLGRNLIQVRYLQGWVIFVLFN
jgi:hypothetical protein